MFQLYVTWDVKPQIFNLGSFEIRWYSVLFALSFIIGYYILSKIFRKEGLKIELLDKLSIYVILSTIIGARFGHCLFYEPEYYLNYPWQIILPWEGTPGKDFKFTGYQGLASHGGAIGLLIGLYIFHRVAKQSYLWILDRLAIVTALASAFIRTGNLMNSEIYGQPTNLPWGFKFMREQYQGIPVNEIVPKHPTQIYEALCYLITFFILQSLYNKKGKDIKPGLLLGIFLILVFTARFFIEYIKENQVDFEAGMVLNMGQWLSLPFIVGGIILLWFAFKKPKTETQKP